nr:hypothetical protein [Tanacetum cinerariifolium]
MQTTQDLEEPSHQEFEIGAADDQPIVEASQHPKWFQLQKKPLTPDRAWNKTLPATHGSIQPWINDLAKKADKSDGRKTLCFQHLSKNVHKKHRHPTSCGRSSARLILTDSQVTLTKPRRMIKPYSSHRFIANYFNAGHLKMEVKVPVSSCLKDL